MISVTVHLTRCTLALSSMCHACFNNLTFEGKIEFCGTIVAERIRNVAPPPPQKKKNQPLIHKDETKLVLINNHTHKSHQFMLSLSI